METKRRHIRSQKFFQKSAPVNSVLVNSVEAILDMKVPAKWYRRIIGSIEVICGFSMATIPFSTVKLCSNVVLILNSLNAIYSHYMVEDKFEKVAPTLVFLFMLIGRLVIDYQGRKALADQQNVSEDTRTKQE
ncbi:uncharacterized protein LOC103515322 [Diaphorina citri]|uniref:Novel acetylcholine receptor chaperone n=1 Tax=Diaphorina citri TaxID=121845 RepID=A0A3Q0JAX3_DIACI|nr:uncharacterized protein LOC103515322 [Diaphorina citri]